VLEDQINNFYAGDMRLQTIAVRIVKEVDDKDMSEFIADNDI
jgi:hypothetical protein